MQGGKLRKYKIMKRVREFPEIFLQNEWNVMKQK